MALKFLNKKGWHTGSLRNIENVWKAEQKHDAEQKKLEELKKQIQEERERDEFRLLQQQAGLVPHQERLEFLYDSGLAVGKTGNSEGFKTLEAFPKTDSTDVPSSSTSASASKQQETVLGALFEDKPQSANDAWRKLHSDPLLMIRQREQEALARIKNNPVQMAQIRKSVATKKHKEKTDDKKESRKKHHRSSSKHKHLASKQKSDSEDDIVERRRRKTGNHIRSDYDKRYHRAKSDSEYESSEGERRRKKDHHKDLKYKEQSPSDLSSQKNVKNYNHDAGERNYERSKRERYPSEGERNFGGNAKREKDWRRGMENRNFDENSNVSSVAALRHESHNKRRNVAPKLSEEERAAKLREMQLAAELHEEQRWKRLKKAEEEDAKEAIHSNNSGGRNFLDAAHKSVYGAEKGGSSTIAESVRRRTHYSQGRSEAGEGNAFRR
ncbi:pre-mRNA-splicing factor CWC25-like [Quillaja saponaria]|uniref:Pre-mRNA-splicing factor CWC25-like n=1 Tax=Quillaja saponaria TaxID=32244 RepID=A0AAD7KV84_QUISA|nr:pre-mRNA-splicing factor CWC25-like [Quillaja saponaria]